MIIKHTLKARIYLVLGILYNVSILILSLVNLSKVEIIKLDASDKIYHAVCYALMAFIWGCYAKLKFKVVNWPIIFRLIILTSLFGIIIEYLQLALTDYRQFDWWDVLANCTGIIIGIIIFKLFQKII